MKTILFIGMAVLCFVFIAHSQTNPSPFPCIRTLSVKSFGNNQICGNISGYQKTGTVIVSFSSSLPLSVDAPQINSLFNTDANGNATTQINAAFMFRSFGETRQTAEYCYYTPTGSNVLSNSSQVRYKATITYTSYDPSTCDVQNIAPGPLPVTFRSFAASKTSQGVALTWVTSTEMNNKGFWIQKRSGDTWNNIVFINSQALYGNSDQDISYTYHHPELMKGIAQYRLQQVDLDGQYKFSEVRIVKENVTDTKFLVFPNPAPKGSNATIVMEDAQATYSIQVMDATGRTLQLFANNKNSCTLSNLNKGQYFVRITNLQSGDATTERFIVQ